MEVTPHVSESDSAKKSLAKKGKAEALGALVVEPEKATASGLAEHAPGQHRAIAPEAHLLHGQTHPTERIGQVVVGAEAPLSGRAEQSATDIELGSGQNIDTLNRSELLSLSEKINVEGSNLRRIYETNLIGERGLRRLVSEYLEGGDIRQSLKLEVLEREIDYERDPAMRDLPAPISHIDNAVTSLSDLLRRADIGTDNHREEVAFFKPRVDHEGRLQAQKQSRRRAMDVGLITIIAVLLTLVIVLYISRR